MKVAYVRTTPHQWLGGCISRKCSHVGHIMVSTVTKRVAIIAKGAQKTQSGRNNRTMVAAGLQWSQPKVWIVEVGCLLERTLPIYEVLY